MDDSEISRRRFCMERRGQRLGPNARGGGEYGEDRRGSCDLLLVRLVAGTALAVVGSGFGVCAGS
jgi:hypothetical protein